MAVIVRGLLFNDFCPHSHSWACALLRSCGLSNQNNHRGVLFTSESVTEGHPDKIADQISDAVLDAALAQDPMSRVACETLLTTGMVIVAGEITTKAQVDYAGIARQMIRETGYTTAKFGIDSDTCSVLSAVHQQSPDIARG